MFEGRTAKVTTENGEIKGTVLKTTQAGIKAVNGDSPNGFLIFNIQVDPAYHHLVQEAVISCTDWNVTII